jgi:hypothetical protein
MQKLSETLFTSCSLCLRGSFLEKLENNTVNALIASLKRHGVSDDVIHEALTEIVNG